MTDTLAFNVTGADADALVDLLRQMIDRLSQVEARLARIDGLLSEFEPVIRAFLDPAATGPLAWAVRRKTR